MEREIKFRAWDGEEMADNNNLSCPSTSWGEISNGSLILMQFTGLKDKNGKVYIYEGDIINIVGEVIGNKYENEDLLKEETNLLIDGICTKEWEQTNQKAMERGCKYA